MSHRYKVILSITIVRNLLPKCIVNFYSILTGNPCTDFRHYRDFVVTRVPQITELDCQQIARSERILAQQGFTEKLKAVEEDQACYFSKREQEKAEEEMEGVDIDDEDQG